MKEFLSIVEQMDDVKMATLLNKMSSWMMDKFQDEFDSNEFHFLYKIFAETSNFLYPRQEGE